MILGIVGTHEQPFDRMIRLIDSCSYNGEKIIQYGYSELKLKKSIGFSFLEFDEVVKYINRADIVISHAGTGCVMLTLSLGKIPIVIPRYSKFGEHIDDHQLQLCHDLSSKGYIVPLYENETLEEKILEHKNMGSMKRKIEPAKLLINNIKAIISNI